MKPAWLALLLALTSTVLAQTYTVDDSGGQLELSEELAEAAAGWNDAAEGANLEQATGATTSFSFADPELLGPDIVSVTLVREGEEGFDVWLNPETLEEFPQALLHELGLLLGLPSTHAESSVMDPALSAETPDAPTAADLQLVVDALSRVGGDINADGTVDISDLSALGRAYGQRGVNLAADLDGDGVVGAEDIALLRENYSFTEPQPVDEPGPDSDQGNETESGDVSEEAGGG